ncbi:hypothetical protein SAMN05216188_11982 [Lentzea xinjiangensis]|uniref:Uncharacterized protein n=1 Tax=Lentzea xinjiangensis TaxID=402600 RepID=A0A1H9TV39_9PSEU|nr:hypothetical protein [Lentzea xinjiangensis]SES00858.1 hypothetical protein SAMN05216188_11982 [Lentzea xinjiangensis]
MTDHPDPVPTVSSDPGGVLFVLVEPTGKLVRRRVSGRVVDDGWGGNFQPELWAAVAAAVDPHRGLVNGVALVEGMWAKVVDVSEDAAALLSDLYPPNPVAWTMLTALGHPARRWFGTIALLGTENEDGVTASLTPDQLDLISMPTARPFNPASDPHGAPGPLVRGEPVAQPDGLPPAVASLASDRG